MAAYFRRENKIGTVLVTILSTAVATAVSAGGPSSKSFNHIATFDVTTNGTEVAEIVDATVNGKGLIYTESGTGAVGFVDISAPSNPLPDGTLGVGGEPTSVAVRARVTRWWASIPPPATRTTSRRSVRASSPSWTSSSGKS